MCGRGPRSDLTSAHRKLLIRLNAVLGMSENGVIICVRFMQSYSILIFCNLMSLCLYDYACVNNMGMNDMVLLSAIA